MATIVESANSNIERAEEIKVSANEAFKGKWESFILPFFICLLLLNLTFGCRYFCSIYHIFDTLLCLHSANKFSQAIDLYSKAIELNGSNAVYWANRAFAHTKLEEYGSAVQDATKAIEIDPRYSKVKKLCPNDPDAAKKLKECEKAVQKLRFEEAIAVHESEKRSIADSIDFHAIGKFPQLK
ncbi:hypothetical protein BHE74_00043686 [Ensete ventricosum]|nr:hypothetical protein GW17_00010695 [Ensete ventricosum]RWW50078.1 hypothetical protein BHE74_00043686 [Ensete ventricosum]RZS06288.1 hypothetical protein BHM03_00036916 [Ensete ventricosum]